MSYHSSISSSSNACGRASPGRLATLDPTRRGPSDDAERYSPDEYVAFIRNADKRGIFVKRIFYHAGDHHQRCPVAAILRGRRKARGISQQQLADKLGLSQSRLSAIEAGSSALSVDRLIILADVLDLEFVLQDKLGEVRIRGRTGPARDRTNLQGSERRDTDLQTLLKAQLLFWLRAATDGHAKNFSIRLLAQGRFELTPLYDVMSAWPVVGNRRNQLPPKKIKLAMGLKTTRKHYHIVEMQRRHFNLVAHRCGLGPDMESVISEVIEATPSVIQRVARELPEKFPAELFEQITTNLQNAAKSLAEMPAE